MKKEMSYYFFSFTSSCSPLTQGIKCDHTRGNQLSEFHVDEGQLRVKDKVPREITQECKSECKMADKMRRLACGKHASMRSEKNEAFDIKIN